MIFLNIRLEDAVAANVLTQEEAGWIDTLRIPYPGTAAIWRERRRIEQLIKDAKTQGILKEIEYQPVTRQQAFYVISDTLGEGVQGVFNHADGKKHDSKSEYYKAVKAAGCVVVGNDAPTTQPYIEPKICDRELKQDIKTAIEQLGG